MVTNQQKYVSNYNKENYKMYQFRIKKSEAKIINLLDSVPNRNNYIFSLIKENLEPSILSIKQIRERIKPIMDKHKIKDVYLFGSYSRGEANRDSDVDIYCERGDVNSLWKQSEFCDELEEALGKKVDVITIGSEMHEFFKRQIEGDMIKIW